jgi:L-arabinose isomerase
METRLPSTAPIGLLILRAEWFDKVVALPELRQAVEVDQERIVQALQGRLNLQQAWTVNSQSSLETACGELRHSKVQGVILVFQVWAEDFYLAPFLQALGNRPLAVWCFQPWQKLPLSLSFLEVLRGSGWVGTFEGLGTLRNLKKPFFFTFGAPHQERVLTELEQFARAVTAYQALKQARFGLLPHRNEQMQSTFVDEFRLLHELGPSVEYLSVQQLAEATRRLNEAEVQQYITELHQEFPLRGVKDETLEQAARVSLGLAHLAVERKLDVLSFNDIAEETHRFFGLRPALYPALLWEHNISIGLEGDLGAATAMFLLQQLSGKGVFFAEFWVWDEAENLIIGGHAGPQNPRLAEAGSVWISPDFEFAQSDASEGAHLQFVVAKGRVTLLQMRCTPQGWQAIATQGSSLGGASRIEGYPHVVLRLDPSIESFLRGCAEVGTTQHFVLTFGDYRREIHLLCEWLGISLLWLK